MKLFLSYLKSHLRLLLMLAQSEAQQQGVQGPFEGRLV